MLLTLGANEPGSRFGPVPRDRAFHILAHARLFFKLYHIHKWFMINDNNILLNLIIIFIFLSKYFEINIIIIFSFSLTI